MPEDRDRLTSELQDAEICHFGEKRLMRLKDHRATDATTVAKRLRELDDKIIGEREDELDTGIRASWRRR